MSLRARLLVSIALILLGALAVGALLLTWRATRSVETEMHAALAGAVDAAREASAHRAGDAQFLSSLVASFDGQRHVRAVLLAPPPGVRAASRLAVAADAPPEWFDTLIRVPPETARIALSGSTLVLTTDPTNEIAEVWTQAEDAFAIMLLFCGGVFLSVYAILGRAIGFFSTMGGALRTVADGDYRERLAETGAPEFVGLARDFNRMATRLDDGEREALALQRQILTLQEEERAEIARDLHDEVGPYLFAIGVDADAMALLPQQAERARAIRDAVAHVRRHIRAILRELRPANPLEFGLREAVADIVAFWTRRSPTTAFDVAIDAIRLDRRTSEAAYRIIQESVSNAVRHGRPSTVRIRVAEEGDAVAISVEDDGEGLRKDSVPGLGLAGMTERARSLGGSLMVTGSRGVSITALLPVERTEEAA
jgi:two-component system, NarL family, sensor histidine kinase UhpB